MDNLLIINYHIHETDIYYISGDRKEISAKRSFLCLKRKIMNLLTA